MYVPMKGKLLTPMLFESIHRISKKYENTGYNGKMQYVGKDSSSLSTLESEERQQLLEQRRQEFLQSRERQKSKSAKKYKHNECKTSTETSGSGSSRGIEGFLQGQAHQGNASINILRPFDLPSREIRGVPEWNLQHGATLLANQPRLLPLTSGHIFPSSLGLGSGGDGLTNDVLGSMHRHRSLTGTTALLGSPRAFTGISSLRPGTLEPSLSLQQLSFQHGNLPLPATRSHAAALNLLPSDSLRRRLEALSYLNEFERSLHQNQDQQRHS